MLVMSRKPHEKILIPAIHACIHVAAVQPGVVRVAINAPPEITILRGELKDRTAEWGPPREQPRPPALPALADKSRRRKRRLRKRLRLASMALGLARLQLLTGEHKAAAAVVGQAQRQIQALRRHVERKRRESPSALALSC